MNFYILNIHIPAYLEQPLLIVGTYICANVNQNNKAVVVESTNSTLRQASKEADSKRSPLVPRGGGGGVVMNTPAGGGG